VVARYIAETGDGAVLDEVVPFLEQPLLEPDQHESYMQPRVSSEAASLFEHCLRAIGVSTKYGAHGLPLIGSGDWNDGMNRVGHDGRGESVWLGWFLVTVLNDFAPLCEQHGRAELAQQYRDEARWLSGMLELAWDGEWYRRAYFDDGTPLGSVQSEECKLDSLTQSWAVISGAAVPTHAERAMHAVRAHLIRRDARVVLLLTPPFDRMPHDPGYIKGYVPGVRENGGQYTHGAIWTVMAFAAMGDVQRAWEFFNLINPVRHAENPTGVARYKVEPYVIAADVYSVPPHGGRGGWTWYTGSAGWAYRLIIETLLGLKLEVDKVRFTPCLPADWRSFKLHYRYRETYYHITFLRTGDHWGGPQKIFLDGAEQAETFLPLQGDRREHSVEVRFS
jgi:cellobiose phosphorylase